MSDKYSKLFLVDRFETDTTNRLAYFTIIPTEQYQRLFLPNPGYLTYISNPKPTYSALRVSIRLLTVSHFAQHTYIRSCLSYEVRARKYNKRESFLGSLHTIIRYQAGMYL